MLPPPPRSTLFPYTTLFRSAPGVVVRVDAQPARGLRPHFANDVGDPVRDRKSTRLNSSHVSISYAVFCLKKKNLHIYNNHIKDPWMHDHNEANHTEIHQADA